MPKLVLLLSTAALFVLGCPTAGHAQVPPGYPYPMPPPYAYRYVGPDANLRIAFKPKTASVYVDGYFAGLVDDYDGAFQRLHLQPGPHDIVVYLKGYRSFSEKMYLGPNATRKISGKLEPLAAGVPDDPLPVPAVPPPPPPGDEPPLPPIPPTYNPSR